MRRKKKKVQFMGVKNACPLGFIRPAPSMVEKQVEKPKTSEYEFLKRTLVADNLQRTQGKMITSLDHGPSEYNKVTPSSSDLFGTGARNKKDDTKSSVPTEKFQVVGKCPVLPLSQVPSQEISEKKGRSCGCCKGQESCSYFREDIKVPNLLMDHPVIHPCQAECSRSPRSKSLQYEEGYIFANKRKKLCQLASKALSITTEELDARGLDAVRELIECLGLKCLGLKVKNDLCFGEKRDPHHSEHSENVQLDSHSDWLTEKHPRHSAQYNEPIGEREFVVESPNQKHWPLLLPSSKDATRFPNVEDLGFFPSSDSAWDSMEVHDSGYEFRGKKLLCEDAFHSGMIEASPIRWHLPVGIDCPLEPLDNEISRYSSQAYEAPDILLPLPGYIPSKSNRWRDEGNELLLGSGSRLEVENQNEFTKFNDNILAPKDVDIFSLDNDTSEYYPEFISTTDKIMPEMSMTKFLRAESDSRKLIDSGSGMSLILDASFHGHMIQSLTAEPSTAFGPFAADSGSPYSLLRSPERGFLRVDEFPADKHQKLWISSCSKPHVTHSNDLMREDLMDEVLSGNREIDNAAVEDFSSSVFHGSRFLCLPSSSPPIQHWKNRFSPVSADFSMH